MVLGAGGKSGVLCAAEARRRGGPGRRVVGVESHARVRRASSGRSGSATPSSSADARDPVAVRRAVLEATGGREADVTFSCVNVPDAEMAAILVTRDRGHRLLLRDVDELHQAALGAEGVGKDVDLFIGNGYAHGHAEHTLAMLRDIPRRCAPSSSAATGESEAQDGTLDGDSTPLRLRRLAAL